MKKYRKERFNELLKRTLSELIFKELKDPRIKGLVSITEVSTANDFKSAKIYVSIYGIDEEAKQSCMNGLKNSSNFLKYRLSKELKLRYTPELIFQYDKSIERGANIIAKIQKLHNKKNEN